MSDYRGTPEYCSPNAELMHLVVEDQIGIGIRSSRPLRLNGNFHARRTDHESLVTCQRCKEVMALVASGMTREAARRDVWNQTNQRYLDSPLSNHLRTHPSKTGSNPQKP